MPQPLDPLASPQELRICLRRASPPRDDVLVGVMSSAGEVDWQPFRPRVDRAQVDAALATAGSIWRSETLTGLDPGREVGMQLFEAVFGGRNTRLYHREANAALNAGASLRLRIVTDDLPTAKLPWELLFDSMVRQDFVVLCRGWSVVREQMAEMPLALRPAEELNVLAVTSTHAGDLRRELPNLTVIQDGTPDDAVRAIAQDGYDVVHFDGPPVDGSGERGLYRGAVARAEQLAQRLSPARRPQLVFVNAADSAEFACVVARHVPAAIGFQGAVPHSAYRSFARVVYRDVLDGLSLDAAVANGRRALDVEHPGSRDWAMPVLYLPPVDAPLVEPSRDAAAVVTQLPRLTGTVEDGRSVDERRLEIRLQIAERNLEALERKGAGAPAFVSAQLDQARREVEDLRAQLSHGH
jgi:hypothetical protein